MIRNFDMNLLVVFNTLMEERSVTRTGERLGRTQSAISNSLKKLREAMGDPLFLREASGLVPTARAAALAPEVERIIQRTESCLQQDVEIDLATNDSHFVIGAPDRLSLPLFLPVMRHIHAVAPNMQVDLRTADRDVSIRLLGSGDIDLGIGWFDELPPRMHRSVAFSEALVCLCRRDHPIARAAPKAAELEMLLQYPHVVVRSGGGRHAAFDAILESRGYKRQVQCALTNFTLVPHLLRGSDQVGIFTKRTADYFAANYELTTIPITLEIAPIHHEIVWHSRFTGDPAHRWLRDTVLKACSGDQ
ncbi:LysR family transcriptional regulator [Pseudooceanicola sp. HF7]|uniref:LysR family transcriptional regulator n=1 Tax=Pseudooceanicola sp. HF7 TaxID=2721560 RepID=UPI001431AB32|nr:LysR family transcriptional regulator [Pseudooceanicola sp. HF7]NIZ08145.1 LysR family transcriptional regulator [Pseudooceanicola sp. HF7]